MPRDIVLGNGKLLVCLDRDLFLRDLYWPHVGLFNHLSGRRVRLGVWVDGRFAWIDDSWVRDIRYRDGSLVSDCRLRHDGLDIELEVADAVDHRADCFLRRVTVVNRRPDERQVRLFWAPDTVICETDIGDTAYYDAFARAVIHYKWGNYLLFSGRNEAGDGLAGYACGMKGLEGMAGTWLDCEDGELSGNPIAQGSVDSAVGVRGPLPAAGRATFYLYLCVGPTREAVMRLQDALNAEGFDAALESTHQHWRAWSAGPTPARRESQADFLAPLPPRVRGLFHRSLLIIRTQIDNGGAILAANDTDIMKTNRAHYSYMWPRDGALVAHALDRAGYGELTRRFFTFCQAVLPGDRAALMHKYAPDGSVGSSWHSFLAPDGTPEAPLQEDETALPIWALWHHHERHGEFQFVEDIWRTFGRPCADFLLSYRDERTGLPLPSWDLWEERRGVHTYTVCTVIAALRASAKFAALFGEGGREAAYIEGAESMLAAMNAHLWAEEHGRYARRLVEEPGGHTWLDMTQDASLHALYQFGVLPVDDRRVRSTMEQVNERLWVRTHIGGMARYEGDYYGRVSDDLQSVPGNPWVICTLWRAQWYIATARCRADLNEPRDLLERTVLYAFPSGVLPEQLNPYTGENITVAPLTWSHAEFVETVFQWLDRWRELAPEA
jgi:Glucoamylase and related glycosyl hydrolases